VNYLISGGSPTCQGHSRGQVIPKPDLSDLSKKVYGTLGDDDALRKDAGPGKREKMMGGGWDGRLAGRGGGSSSPSPAFVDRVEYEGSLLNW